MLSNVAHDLDLVAHLRIVYGREVGAIAAECVPLVRAGLDRTFRRCLGAAQLDALLQRRNEVLQAREREGKMRIVALLGGAVAHLLLTWEMMSPRAVRT